MSIQRVALLLALLVALPLAAEQWEGSAARIRPGEFSGPGLLAASNSFPEGTKVRVTSRSTGKSVEVTIARRVDETSGIFLLLSAEAADALGIAKGDVAHVVAAPVTVVPPRDVAAGATSARDPDDPRAGLTALAEELRSREGSPAQAQSQPAAPAQPQPTQPPQVAVQPPAEKPPAAPPQSDELAPYVARTPQKQLFLPPHEEEGTVTSNPPPPVVTSPPLEEPAPPAVATKEAPPEATEEPPHPAEVALAEPPLAAPEPPAEAAEAPVVVPAPAQEGPVVTSEVPAPEEQPSPAIAHEPGFPLAGEEGLTPPKAAPEPEPVTQLAGAPAPAPPPEQAAAQPAPAPAPAPAAAAAPEAVHPPVAAAPKAPAVTTPRPLPPGTHAYYVQLGAFADQDAAQDLVRRYSETYPLDVLEAAARSGRSVYRVVVGPLGRDETGSVLLRFQSLGFRDAFVRSMN